VHKQRKNGDAYRREVLDFLERLEFLERVDFWLPLGEEGLQRRNKIALKLKYSGRHKHSPSTLKRPKIIRRYLKYTVHIRVFFK
jgi:hypothetical protein